MNPTTTAHENLYDVLGQRGLLAQCTDEQIRARLAKPVAAYIGFDPTADSLHVGSLVPIMGLAHLQRCGHKPIVLIGGATALVGDPSGKTEARKMLSREQIDANAQAIAAQIQRVVRFDDSPTGAVMVNNADWLAGKTWIDMLREVGSHFSVNRMLSMDSVKGRLEAGGITYLEFSYMVMQAYDFLHLNETIGCTVQMGGQDQWGNIVMGIELARRMRGVELAGLTLPLVTKSDGGKFGKSEAGNVWLDANRTSPYEFYQFWRNVSDADVGKFLGYFTFLTVDEIRSLADLKDQAINEAKEILAYEVTKLIHGPHEAQTARDSAKAAFGATKDVTGDAIPRDTLAAADLAQGLTIVQLLTKAGLAASNSEARRLVQGGGVRLHDQLVTDIQHQVTASDVRDGYILLRAGKKRLFRYDVQP
jgi:tyrosyl-tRNA synthetase